MNTYIRRIAAVVEVALVFLLAPYLTKSIYLLFPQFEAWQTQTLGFPVAPFVYVVEAGLSILIILLHRRKLADYGLYSHGFPLPSVWMRLPGAGLSHWQLFKLGCLLCSR
jgi:hypothetical protein